MTAAVKPISAPFKDLVTELLYREDNSTITRPKLLTLDRLLLDDVCYTIPTECEMSMKVE